VFGGLNGGHDPERVQWQWSDRLSSAVQARWKERIGYTWVKKWNGQRWAEMFGDRGYHTKEDWFRVEVRVDGDITPNRQTRKWCAINYKLRGIQSEICKSNSE
jgi:hypothetical protein